MIMVQAGTAPGQSGRNGHDRARCEGGERLVNAIARGESLITARGADARRARVMRGAAGSSRRVHVAAGAARPERVAGLAVGGPGRRRHAAVRGNALIS